MSASKQANASGRGLTITLKRSPIGTPWRHRLVLQGLGLRRVRQSVQHPDTPQVRGMIQKVGYLLEVRPQ
ncbi:MAG TPA: 50S ribosomal protein L30 [Nitrospiraceae bacterium]|jgi:large subunit ribosomal protein L30|nr:50S ribosomal protein L30 [Nitrospiraceae bacterium]